MLIRIKLFFGALLIVSNLSAQVTSFNGIAFGTSYDVVKRILQQRGYEVPILEEKLEPMMALLYLESLNGLSPDGIVFSFSLNRELVAGTYMWSISLSNTSDQIQVKELMYKIEDEVEKKYGLGIPTQNREQQIIKSSKEDLIWNEWKFKNGYEGGDVRITYDGNIVMLAIINNRYYLDALRREQGDQL
jgi:hypothetical protein